jgi:hypothetical protein
MTDEEIVELVFEAKAVALELQDAFDDLNESIVKVVEIFREKRLPKGRAEIDAIGHILVWDGVNLLVQTNMQSKLLPLQHSPKAMRIAAVSALEPLLKNCIGG